MAPGWSRISGSVSSRSYSFWSAAPDDCMLLKSCDSIATGSNTLDRRSTKAATVPTDTVPWCTSQPPTPTTAPAAATPAHSTSPKYQTDTRTELMWASYSARFVFSKRRICSSSRA